MQFYQISDTALGKLVVSDGRKINKPGILSRAISWMPFYLRPIIFYGLTLLGATSCIPDSTKKIVTDIHQPEGIVTTDTGLPVAMDSPIQGPKLIHDSQGVATTSNQSVNLESKLDPNLPAIDLTVPPAIKNPPFFSPEYKVDPNVNNLDLRPVQDYYKFVGNLAAFIGLERRDFPIGLYDGTPMGLEGSFGYNISKTNRDEGRVIFPNVRFRAFGNNPDYPWGNYGEFCFGVLLEKEGWGIGLEGGNRQPFRPGSGSDNVQWSSYLGQEAQDFFRAFFTYYNNWNSKSIPQLGSTHFFELQFDSSIDNLIFDGRADLHYKILLLGEDKTKAGKFLGVAVSPFLGSILNADSNKEPYNGHFTLSAGANIDVARLNLCIEIGERYSFNDERYAGPVYRCILQLRMPLDCGRYTSRP